MLEGSHKGCPYPSRFLLTAACGAGEGGGCQLLLRRNTAGGRASPLPAGDHSPRVVQDRGCSTPSSLLPDRLRGRLEAGAAGTAKAGIILIAAQLGLQDQIAVGQLWPVHTLPAQVPGLGGQCCGDNRRDKGVKTLWRRKSPTDPFFALRGKQQNCQISKKCSCPVLGRL